MKKLIITGIVCFLIGVLFGVAVLVPMTVKDVDIPETLPATTEATEASTPDTIAPATEEPVVSDETEATETEPPAEETEETTEPTKPSNPSTPPATTAPAETTVPSETTEPVLPEQGEDELPIVPA